MNYLNINLRRVWIYTLISEKLNLALTKSDMEIRALIKFCKAIMQVILSLIRIKIGVDLLTSRIYSCLGPADVATKSKVSLYGFFVFIFIFILFFFFPFSFLFVSSRFNNAWRDAETQRLIFQSTGLCYEIFFISSCRLVFILRSM